MSGYVLVPVSGGEYAARVSMADADLAADFKWFKWQSPGGHIYARRNDKAPRGKNHGKNIMLHREVAERMFGAVSPGLQVDHMNRDSLDCRRENLRLVTRSKNVHNSFARAASGFKGVHDRGNGSWRAALGDRQLGTFASGEEAALAFDRAAIRRYGPDATTNQSLGLVSPDEGHHLRKIDGRTRPRGLRVDNHAGYCGVMLRPSGTYRARIRRCGRTLWDKSGFETAREASLARSEMLLELGMQ